MDSLEKKLRDELLKDSRVKLLVSQSWTLPVHEIEISFETVKRAKMDILMKMLLITFRKMPFDSAEKVSDLLRVEPLFVEDMTGIMERAGLIVRKEGRFALTKAGEEQLESGIYTEAPERRERTALYSAVHERFLHGEPEEAKEEPFKYAPAGFDVDLIPESAVMTELESTDAAWVDGNVQQEIHGVRGARELEIHLILCRQFILRHAEDDRLFVRVWNTMTGEWDSTLEQLLMERELAEWRERYA